MGVELVVVMVVQGIGVVVEGEREWGLSRWDRCLCLLVRGRGTE